MWYCMPHHSHLRGDCSPEHSQMSKMRAGRNPVLVLSLLAQDRTVTAVMLEVESGERRACQKRSFSRQVRQALRKLNQNLVWQKQKTS